jgi:iron-sulfur cluster repair protein YtfE (RIC family)
MTTITQPLRDEHRDLMPQIDALQTLADAVGKAPAGEIVRNLDATTAFLANHLLVHAQAEEQVLYPTVAKVLGAPAATATMSRDHVAINQMTTDLQALRRTLNSAYLTISDEQALRRLLYGLHTLVRVHLAKEEEVFLPALDAALTADEARNLFTTMERTAHDIMAHAGHA